MRLASIRQCAILVGGPGTRLGDLTVATPKPLLSCGDRPFLAWLLKEFVRQGLDDFLLLTGYLSDVVEAALPSLIAELPQSIHITCCPEPIRAGTGGALYHARDRFAERFLVCNGDSYLEIDLQAMFAQAAADPEPFVGRMALRPMHDASRYGVVELQGERIVSFKECPEGGSPGIINAGMYVFSHSMLAELTPVCSLERDVLPTLVQRGALRGTISDGYFIDIGIPADLKRSGIELPKRLQI